MNRKSFGFFIRAFALLALFAFTSFLFFSCKSKNVHDDWIPSASTLAIENDLFAQHKILLAFADAYPDRISNVQFINDDWTMLVNDKLFYYAHGRFLPEDLRDQWEEYHPYDFYVYPWKGSDALRQLFIDNPVYSTGSSFLFDALYECHTEEESRSLQVECSFIGINMLVHPYIKSKLDIIADEILAAARRDRGINEWIAEVQIDGLGHSWNWRVIAGTNRRSYHSYGTAIDLLPADLKGRLTYWRWNEDGNKKVNRKNYYMPPKKVIKIFEEYGFIWGGGWELIDTMHFEYRPEMLLLNGFKIK